MLQTRYFDLDRRHAAFGIQRFDRLDGMRVPMHTLAGFLHADFRIPSVDYATFLRATRAITHDEREVDVCGEARVPGRADLLRLADEAAVPVAEARGVIDLIASVASNLKVRLADHPIRKVRQREVISVVGANLARLV